MSSETATAETPPEADTGTGSAWTRWLAVLAGDRERVVRGATVPAATVVALQTLLRILRNLPFDPLTVPTAVRGSLGVGAPFVVALATVTVALASRRGTASVGLLFVGAFGSLTAVSTAATLPAVVGVIAGGAVAMLGSVGRPESYHGARRVLVGTVFVAGVALSLGSAIGLWPGARELGTALALLGLAATGLLVEGDRLGLVAGALAFVAVVGAAGVSPYIAGSVLLVGFSVVGVPHLLVALAAGGCVTAFVAGVRDRDGAVVAAITLLLAAGVPVTVPRAMAVLLGATVVLVGPEGLLTGTNTTPEGTR